MKKIILFSACFFCSLFVFAEETKENAASGSAIGFFITESGYAVTRYQLIGDASEISATLGGNPVQFEFVSGDVINDLAVIKSKSEIKAKPVSLLMGEGAQGQKAVCLTCEKNQEGEPVSSLVNGVIQSATGINGDIHHFKVGFDSGLQPKEGIVFNLSGVGLGMISNKMTDVYSLVHDEKEADRLCLAAKMDSLFPLVKDLPGVSWVKPEEKNLSDEDWKTIQDESVIVLQIKGKMPLKSGLAESFSQVLTQIPSNALFIMVTATSGYSNVNFAEKLMAQLKKQKIGSTLSPTLKQQYYNEVYKRFGHPNLNADQLVKIAAGLAEGYYLEAGCSIVSGEVEDHVNLALYKPNTAEPLITVRQAKVIKTEPEKTLDELTELAVKQLGKEIKAKKIKL
ncbi:MAG: serine protease [Candidatus Aureabacteria bacterium]|nr:serine protease [Candidatus Auribacterota bacterium]